MFVQELVELGRHVLPIRTEPNRVKLRVWAGKGIAPVKKGDATGDPRLGSKADNISNTGRVRVVILVLRMAE